MIFLACQVMPLFADLFHNGPETLAPHEQPGPSYVHFFVSFSDASFLTLSLTIFSWYPTLTFSLDFKASFPLLPTPLLSGHKTQHARRTVGLFSRSSFIHDGRHDQIVEVWSAPSGIGEGEVGSEKWREGCQILAISTQVSLRIFVSSLWDWSLSYIPAYFRWHWSYLLRSIREKRRRSCRNLDVTALVRYRIYRSW